MHSSVNLQVQAYDVKQGMAPASFQRSDANIRLSNPLSLQAFPASRGRLSVIYPVVFTHL